MQIKKTKEIITVASLKSFFYESLSTLNQSTAEPLPQQAIFYSSDVLERFSISGEYFENTNGKVQEKVLGIKLLEARNLPDLEKEKTYRDVAETSLILCGCFSSSLNKKLVDRSYYINIGKMAFNQMDAFRPNYLDFPNFFDMMATQLERLTSLIDLMAKKNSPAILLEQGISDKEAAILGITLPDGFKVS